MPPPMMMMRFAPTEPPAVSHMLAGKRMRVKAGTLRVQPHRQWNHTLARTSPSTGVAGQAFGVNFNSPDFKIPGESEVFVVFKIAANPADRFQFCLDCHQQRYKRFRDQRL